MTDAKEKNLGETLVSVGLPIVFGLIAPTISRALNGGTPPEIIAGALVAASYQVAVGVVEERHGGKVSPLVVLAVQLDDLAAKADALGKPIAAAHIREEAHKLRADAATAPTDPAPGGG